jgi:hypothetical protein
MATIRMGGDRLPPQVIVSGKAGPRLRRFGSIGLPMAEFRSRGRQALGTFVR